MDIFSKIKEYIKNFNLQKFNFNSKLAVNLIIIFAVGICFILIADFYNDLNIGAPAGQSNENKGAAESQISTEKSGDVAELEKRLTDILGKIQNAGKVTVMITLKTGTEIIPAKDESISDKTTNENDTEGGTRTINEKNTSDQIVFMNDQGGTSKPLVLKEVNPEIKGVIIVAEGAKDPKVKLKLTEAVQTVLDVPAYRVSVFESNK